MFFSLSSFTSNYMLSWRWLTRRSPSTPSQIRYASDFRSFEPGDLVLLREKLNRSAPPILTRPLRPGRQVQSHKGVIRHEELIGKRVRDVVSASLSSKKDVDPQKPRAEYRLHDVKLDEYIRLSKRLVTPVYPSDARLIVELLDLHPGTLDESNGAESEKLEILEAGTGHGGLTLYLSRAIHGANGSPPKDCSSDDEEAYASWKDQRRAVVHSLDISEKYSNHARKVVRGFRRGLYYHNINFHVAAVSGWLLNELKVRSNEPFLSHAILDLPNANHQLDTVAEALRVDGPLVVFNPSITQITQCAVRVREKGIPLELERVVELPTNGEAGGREWDVRAVKPRATSKGVNDPIVDTKELLGDSSADGEGQAVEDASRESEAVKSDERWQMVCRPKVGDRIIGGGFLGVWKKQRAAPTCESRSPSV